MPRPGDGAMPAVPSPTPAVPCAPSTSPRLDPGGVAFEHAVSRRCDDVTSFARTSFNEVRQRTSLTAAVLAAAWMSFPRAEETCSKRIARRRVEGIRADTKGLATI